MAQYNFPWNNAQMSIHSSLIFFLNFCHYFTISSCSLPTIQDFKIYNATLPQLKKGRKWQLLPNGNFKAQFKYWNKEDEKILQSGSVVISSKLS